MGIKKHEHLIEKKIPERARSGVDKYVFLWYN